MRIRNIDYFYKKHSNQKCLILGSGPSSNEIDIKSFDGIVISMGDMPLRIKDIRKVDYWVVSNGTYPLADKDYEDINQLPKTKLLFSHSAMPDINYEKIEKNLKLDWFDFDQRHFNGKSCNHQIDKRVYIRHSLKCCQNIGNVTVQEYLQSIFNTNNHYSTGDTTAIHALAFAMIMGFKDIYITGVDLPLYIKNYNYYGHNFINYLRDSIRFNGIKYTIKYATSAFLNLDTKSVFYEDLPEILHDFSYLNSICNKNNINLYNLSKESCLNKIHDFKYLSPKSISKIP